MGDITEEMLLDMEEIECHDFNDDLEIVRDIGSTMICSLPDEYPDYPVGRKLDFED